MARSKAIATAFFRFAVDVVALIAAGVLVVMAIVPDEFGSRMLVLAPYFIILSSSYVVVALALGVNRTVWRFTGLEDLAIVAIAVVISLVMTLGLGFVVNRLEGVFRTLPVLQGAIAIFFSWFLRAAFVLHWRLRTRRRKSVPANGQPGELVARQHIVIVGMNQLANLYISGLAEFAGDTAEIAGLLSPVDRHKGRLVQQYKVLGQPIDVRNILSELRIHGIDVDTLVVTVAFDEMCEASRNALLEVERSGEVRLVLLSELLGAHRNTQRHTAAAVAGPTKTATAAIDVLPLDDTTSGALKGRSDAVPVRRTVFLVFKRVVDVVGAIILSILLMPVAALVSLAIMIDDGMPILFWQRRPGRNGRPLRIYKFRTMRRAHDAHGKRIEDASRTSPIGRFLRRARLDEIPQLYHVLIGEMSFIGPRPLLPSDQTTADHNRLSVRPGITGYAQVCGCNRLSVEEKMLLDAWYVENMSLRLDLEIVIKTLRTLVLGEHRDEAAISLAKALAAERVVPQSTSPAAALPSRVEATSEEPAQPADRMLNEPGAPAQPDQLAEPVRDQGSAAVIDLAAERRKSAAAR